MYQKASKDLVSLIIIEENKSDQFITHPLESLPAILIVNGYSSKVKFNQNWSQAQTQEDKHLAACQLKLLQGKETGFRSVVTEGAGSSILRQ